MNPLRVSFSASSLGLAAASLAAGFSLGWILIPWQAHSPLKSPGSPAAKPPPLGGSRNSIKDAPPYDLRPLQDASSTELAAFEAWLATATSDEIWALAMDNTLLGFRSSVVTSLLTQRFRAFPTGERLATLRKNVEPGKIVYDSRHEALLFALVADLVPAHCADAASVVKHLSDGQGYGIATALRSWAQQNFAAALAFGTSLGQVGPQLRPALIGYLAEKDLPAAQAQALLLPAGAERDSALASIGFAMARGGNLRDAIAWLLENGGGRSTARGSWPLGSILQSAAYADPSAVATIIAEQPGLFEGPSGPNQVTEIFGAWAGQDAAAATEWLKANPLPGKFHVRAEAAVFRHRLAEMPEEAAVREWQALPEPVQKATARAFAQRLAEEDPATVLDRIAVVFPENQRGQAMGWVLDSVPDRARQILRWLPQLMPMFKESSGYDHWLTALPPGEFDEALATLPEEDRVILQEKSAGALISEDPNRALAALPPIRPNAADPFLYSRIAVELAQSEPGKAAAWVAGFEEGSSKEWTAQNLVATWAKFDPKAATSWVEELPVGKSRDRAIVELARLQGLTGGHEAALTLAATVQDEGRRTEAAGLALQSLWYRDRVAAEAALAGTSMSSDARAHLMARLAKGDFQR